MVVLRNCEESESDKVIEYSEELNGFYFPPSPAYFPPLPTTFPLSPSSPPPPSSSNSSVRYVWDAFFIFVPRNYLDEEIVDLPDFYLALLVEHRIQDRGGALDVIPSGRLVKINELVQRLDDIVDSEAKNKALELVDDDYSLTEDVEQDFEPLEKQNEDIVDQLVIDSVRVTQHLIQYTDGALYSNTLGQFGRTNGSEISYGQLLTSTAETGLIFQTKLSLRVWQGHRGQWVADICYRWNWLNIGTLKTAEGAHLSSESVVRYRGGKDLFDYPFSELFVNENRAEPTTKPRTEIQTLEFSLTEEQEIPNEYFGFYCCEAIGNDGVEAEATRTDGVEAFGKRKRKEKMPGGERANKKTTRVRNVITLEDILQTKRMLLKDAAKHLKVSQSKLKSSCREYGIHRWPPRDEHKLVRQSLPDEITPIVDQDGILQLISNCVPSNQPLVATDDANTVVKEIPPPWILPTPRQENRDENFANDEIDVIGMGAVGTGEGEMEDGQLNYGCSGKWKTIEKKMRGNCGESESDKTIEQSEELNYFYFSPSPPFFPPLPTTFPPLPLCFPPYSPASSNSSKRHGIYPEETMPQQLSPTVRQEKPDEDSDNNEVKEVGMGGVGTGEGGMPTNGKALGGERGGVRIKIPLEEILKYSHMHIEAAAWELKVSQSKLKSSCWEYGIHRWPPRDEHKLVRQSLPDEITPIVDQDGIPQLISNCVPSNQPLVATDDANTVVKEIPPPWISPTPRQENRDENFANDEIDVIGMGGVGTGEGEMEEGQLNSGCSGKGKWIEKTSRGERGNNKTTGVRIAISLEDILQTKEMRLKDAAKDLNVSRSTLKRACREYNIYRWPPRGELKLSSQYSPPNKSPTVVGQGQIPQLNYDMFLPPNQVPTTMNTNSTVTIKARCGKETIKFRLSWPWGTTELKQQVKKRLELEDGTYYIRYKDEDGELILIACDDDLQDCVSSSSPLGSKSIEILLEPK